MVIVLPEPFCFKVTVPVRISVLGLSVTAEDVFPVVIQTTFEVAV